NTLRRRNARVDFVLQPVLGNFPLHTLHVPGEAHAKIAAAAGKTESTFRAARAEIAIRPTDRAAFSEGNLVGLLLRFGLWLFFGYGRGLLRLDFGILPLNLDCIGLNLRFRLRLRLGYPL